MAFTKYIKKKIIQHFPAVIRAIQRTMSNETKIDLVKNEMRNNPEIVDSMFPYRDIFPIHHKLPERGLSREEILKQIEYMHDLESPKWHSGKISGSFYHGEQDYYDFLNEAFSYYSQVNSIQRDVCPSLTKFEGEIISMSLDIFHGDAVHQRNPSEKACGSLTTGGTDSIFQAVYVHREWGLEKGINQPEMIVPVSAHPAFFKAAHYLNVKVVVANLDQNFQADVGDIEHKITPNTVLIVGSAGNYGHGIIDPLDRLSDLALKYNVGLHVDACLGGFILAWAEPLGINCPVFDFRLPGVTSISADTHKYGYSLKGTSVVLFRNERLRRFQYFGQVDWPGGVYVSTGFNGSKSGGLFAATWAAMVHYGKEGYMNRAKQIFEANEKMKNIVRSIPELKLIGDSLFMTVLSSDVFNIYHVNDYLKTKGWRLNGQQHPNALHFCITGPQIINKGIIEEFEKDLKAAVEYAKVQKNPPRSAAMYGGAGREIDPSMYMPMLIAYTDVTQSTYPF
ncbi:MAG: aminotransferase class V-fold PLP-dependent enzyme [Chitinophagales bacterium]|nr:aminotransferase class V-fold PLP-dependent enzyme [Chitinophagales bacterium]MDW8273254.1 aminotransferase class V-fold PLP-dependent enzyme [Chitinophagales bacterium]